MFGLPVLHEGTTSLGFIGEEAADLTRGAIINPLMDLTLADPAAQRLLDQLGGYERRLAEKHARAAARTIRSAKPIRTQLLDSSYARFHTYQELSMPMMLGGFLSLTPAGRRRLHPLRRGGGPGRRTRTGPICTPAWKAR